MNKLIIITLALITLSSCRKDKTILAPSQINNIIGNYNVDYEYTYPEANVSKLLRFNTEIQTNNEHSVKVVHWSPSVYNIIMDIDGTDLNIQYTTTVPSEVEGLSYLLTIDAIGEYDPVNETIHLEYSSTHQDIGSDVIYPESSGTFFCYK